MTNLVQSDPLQQEKHLAKTAHVEDAISPRDIDSEFQDEDGPEFHGRTWFALAAMFMLNLVQVFGLLGPPAGVSKASGLEHQELTQCLNQLSYIEEDLPQTNAGKRVPQSLSLVQAVVAPLIASISDTFQVRKLILVGASTISFIGSAIAPSATTIYRVIAAQVLIGFGFATVPLAYCVPSEILPRKWRPRTSTSSFRPYSPSCLSLHGAKPSEQWHTRGLI